ncbi:hypothetical protein A1Q2_05768 [Trichosporon asahii var. asahii CBS 8904]|uniref:Methyltransferase type 11 domain-containing protein n=1 Tax=Trichosporon asahii var. asahii (strain CBS 8904) TaxID=1220162 RepID=K1V7G8_TRIAC|nr:hypothetical protein A1Q2_05768 [Trichosporon asahii var. asahii CBS 8904]
MAGDDVWDGAVYLNKPGVKEAAEINGRTIKRALVEAGIPESKFPTLDVLEVGAGVGTVTRHLTGFHSVHSIEPSRSMISVLSKQVEGLDNVTWAMHEFGPTSAAQFDRGEEMPSPIESDPERKLAPPRKRFDVAVATLVAHHVGTLKPFFEGVLSVLKPGGLFILIEFRHGDDGEDISAVFHVKEEPKNEPVEDWDQGVITGNQFRTTPTKAQLGGLLTKYGFTGVGDMDGEGVPAFRLERGPVPTLVVWGRRPE